MNALEIVLSYAEDQINWWNKLTPQQQKAYLKQHPKSKEKYNAKNKNKNLEIPSIQSDRRKISNIKHEEIKESKALNKYYIDRYDEVPFKYLKSMRLYAGDGYRPINNFLRGKSNITDPQKLYNLEETIKNIDTLVKAFKIPTEVKLYRGLHTKKLNYQVGKVYSNPGFLSTTTDKQTARSFTGYDNDDRVIFEFSKTKGKHGAVVINDRFDEQTGEKEILMARGQKFKVTEVGVDKNRWGGSWIFIKAEFI